MPGSTASTVEPKAIISELTKRGRKFEGPAITMLSLARHLVAGARSAGGSGGDVFGRLARARGEKVAVALERGREQRPWADS